MLSYLDALMRTPTAGRKKRQRDTAPPKSDNAPPKSDTMADVLAAERTQEADKSKHARASFASWLSPEPSSKRGPACSGAEQQQVRRSRARLADSAFISKSSA